MPIREYECKNGHRFEVIDVKNENFEQVACRECDANATRVQFSTSSFQWGVGPKESNVSRAIKRVKAKGL